MSDYQHSLLLIRLIGNLQDAGRKVLEDVIYHVFLIGVSYIGNVFLQCVFSLLVFLNSFLETRTDALW